LLRNRLKRRYVIAAGTEAIIAAAELLLAHGANIDAIDEEYRSTPLGVAARRGQLAIVELLLEHGADPTAAGAPWATPLAWAEKKSHPDVARMLAFAKRRIK
jgi:uncharacterized protein